jgi:protein-L-isoaspartate(D-aspartate) O-methyltransferase
LWKGFIVARVWLLIALLVPAAAACGTPDASGTGDPSSTARRQPQQESADPPQTDAAAEFERRRSEMLEQQIRSRGITDERVLQAIGNVPRHEFVPETMRDEAYADGPLPIGHGQTISQPYIVALMTQAVRPKQTDKVLDIGTGSGYQAAVLAELVDHVWSIEIVEPLGEEAEKRLQRLDYKNVTVRIGDGFQGWPEEAPFDVIVLAAAPAEIPPPLIEQLAPGGRLVLPVGERDSQRLLLVEKDDSGNVTR